MSWFGEALEGVRDAFDFVSGANDVVVVRHPDGRLFSSPFNVQTNAITVNRRFLGRGVDVFLNGRLAALKMKINDDGLCVFLDGRAVPPDEDLQLLPLKDGRNSLDFRIEDTIIASAGLFAWSNNDRVIVVDIDGTVTRTDAGGVLASSELGQSLGLLHFHKGVSHVLALLVSAGYRLMFLTARPITRSEATRRYLAQVGQAEGVPFPQGALVTSGRGSLGAIAIWTDMHRYKLGTLQEMQALFEGGQRAPPCFVGGFGNHDYDARAYIEAGCPETRTFLIDEDSNVSVQGCEVVYKGYEGMMPLLEKLFPPVAVVEWEKARAAHAPPAAVHGGQAAAKAAFSMNKIPGAALLGEVTGSAIGKLAEATTTVTSAGVSSLQKIPGAESLQVPHFEVPSLPLPGLGGGREAPPPYDDPETHGLEDLGE